VLLARDMLVELSAAAGDCSSSREHDLLIYESGDGAADFAKAVALNDFLTPERASDALPALAAGARGVVLTDCTCTVTDASILPFKPNMGDQMLSSTSNTSPIASSTESRDPLASEGHDTMFAAAVSRPDRDELEPDDDAEAEVERLWAL